MSEPKNPESEPTTPSSAASGTPATNAAKPATGSGAGTGTKASQPTKPGQPSAPAKTGRQRKEEAKAHDPLRGSRSSGFYAAVVALAVVLVLLIIFILQNSQTARVNFLVWHPTAPTSVVLLIAAAAGLFLALVASSLRIFQLRRRVKRERKAAA